MKTLSELQEMSVKERARELGRIWRDKTSSCLSDWMELAKLFDPEPLPDNLEELAEKLYDIAWPINKDIEKVNKTMGPFRKIASYVAPHLTTGLNPGDECQVRDEADGVWVKPYFYIGVQKNGIHLCEDYAGKTLHWQFCEPIPKKQRYLISYSQIVVMAEKGNSCLLADNGCVWVKEGRLFTPEFLIAHSGQSAFGLDVPEEWIEER